VARMLSQPTGFIPVEIRHISENRMAESHPQMPQLGAKPSPMRKPHRHEVGIDTRTTLFDSIRRTNRKLEDSKSMENLEHKSFSSLLISGESRTAYIQECLEMTLLKMAFRPHSGWSESWL
jgi:hypothetical protein